MSPRNARIAFSVLALLALAAFGLIAHEFDPNDPWFFIGLAALVVCTVIGNAVLRESHAHTLSDEFEAGYRVGYRAGRRSTLSIARPDAPSDPIPLRPRRTRKDVTSWPDSESSPRGSTRLP